MSILASNLKLLREEASMSINDLSEKTGINEQLLIAFEEDRITPNEYQIEVLCRVLKMPSEDITTRDLKVERAAATKGMRSKETREQYNWYFGNKKRIIFYIAYLAFFVIATTILALYVTNRINAFFLENTMEQLKDYYYIYYSAYPFVVFLIVFFWQLSKFGFIVYGLGISFFIIFDFLWGRRVYFRWWYIFWIGVIFTLVVFLGIFGALPYFVYTIVRLIKEVIRSIRGKY